MKLGFEKFNHYSQDGQHFSYECEIGVQRDGLFYFSILPEFNDVFKAVKETKAEYSQINSTINHRKGISIITCPVKETGIHFMKNLIKKYYKCEATEEYVIRYLFINKTLSVKDNFGRHYGSSSLIPKEITEWERAGDFDISAGSQSDFYYVGLNAGLYRKQTFKRGDKTTTKYILVTVSCRDQIEENGEIVFKDTYATKLASFTCLSTYVHKYEGQWKEIPYSENAAKFFYELLISICQMGEKIIDFFENPKSQAYISERKTDDTELSLSKLIEYKNTI